MEFLKRIADCCKGSETKGEDQVEGKNPTQLPEREKKSTFKSKNSLIQESTVVTPNQLQSLMMPSNPNRKIKIEPPSFAMIHQFGHRSQSEPREEIKRQESSQKEKLLESFGAQQNQMENPEDELNLAGQVSAFFQVADIGYNTPEFKGNDFTLFAGQRRLPQDNQSPEFQPRKNNTQEQKTSNMDFSASFKQKKVNHRKTPNSLVVSQSDKLRFTAYASGTMVNSSSRRMADARKSEKEAILMTISEYDKKNYMKNPKNRRLREISHDLLYKTKCCKGLVETQKRSLTPQPFHMSKRPLY